MSRMWRWDFSAPDEAAGKRAKCPKCSATIKVSSSEQRQSPQISTAGKDKSPPPQAIPTKPARVSEKTKDTSGVLAPAWIWVGGGVVTLLLVFGLFWVSSLSKRPLDTSATMSSNAMPAQAESAASDGQNAKPERRQLAAHNDIAHPLIPNSDPIPSGMAKLTIITVPRDVHVRVLKANEVLANAQQAALLSSAFQNEVDLGKAAFDAAFTGSSEKSPLQKCFSPGQYVVSVEFVDTTSEQH